MHMRHKVPGDGQRGKKTNALFRKIPFLQGQGLGVEGLRFRVKGLGFDHFDLTPKTYKVFGLLCCINFIL